jgi:hypothetical protein
MALAFPIRCACRNCGGTTCSKTCFEIQEISRKPPIIGGFLFLIVFIDNEIYHQRRQDRHVDDRLLE